MDLITARSPNDSGQSGCLWVYSLIGSSFTFSPAAILLSLSFLRRWQVKRPIRAGQRGRANHSLRIPNSVEKERYLIERLSSPSDGNTRRRNRSRYRNIGRVRFDRFEHKIRDLCVRRTRLQPPLQTDFLNEKAEVSKFFLNFSTPQILCDRKHNGKHF